MESGTDGYICNLCRSRIKYCNDRECCKICGKPQESLGKDKICGVCKFESARRFKRAAAVAEYENPVSGAIKRYKDGGPRIAGKVFAKEMAGRFYEEFGDIKFDAMVSVAQNRKRNNERGFDPVDNICKNLSDIISVPYIKGVLYRKRETKKQSGLSYDERVENLIGAIGVNSGFDAAGKTALLIDDIMTTGATIDECSAVLKDEGVKNVYALTFATTVKHIKKFK